MFVKGLQGQLVNISKVDKVYISQHRVKAETMTGDTSVRYVLFAGTPKECGDYLNRLAELMTDHNLFIG